jgi:hypothetical protein
LQRTYSYLPQSVLDVQLEDVQFLQNFQILLNASYYFKPFNVLAKFNCLNLVENISEEKGEKWIQDAIKRPGALRKKLGKKGEEKISKGEIEDELSKLKKKDKDPKKSGVQGLSKRDLKRFKCF